jgi:hypothetical protein
VRRVPRLLSAAVTAGLAGLTALATLAGPGVLAAAIIVTQVLFVVGWQSAVELPEAAGGVAVPVVAAVVADELVVAGAGGSALTPLTWVLGIGVLAAFVAQMLRAGARAGLTSSLASAILAMTVSVLGVMTLAAALTGPTAAAATALVSVGVLGATVSAVALALLRPWDAGSASAAREAPRAGAVIVAAVLAGLAASAASRDIADLGLPAAVATAFGGGVAALLASSLARATVPTPDPLGLPSERAAQRELGQAVVAGALPLLLVAPLLVLPARLVWA